LIKRINWRDKQLAALLLPLSAALILFALACGQPFALLGEGSVDRIPYLREFRGIGRFAWPAYFALTLTAVVLLDRATRDIPRQVNLSLTIGFFFLVVGEAGYLHSALRKQREEGPNPFAQPTGELATVAELLKQSGAAALLPLPYFHVGSEAFIRVPTGTMQSNAMSLSLHSGLPLMAAHLTRTSVSETRHLLELTAPKGYDKRLANTLPPESTIALVALNEHLEQLRHPALDEGRLWQNAQELFSGERYSIRVIPASALIRPEAEDINIQIIAEDALDGDEAGAFEGSRATRLACTDFGVFFTAVPDSSWLHRPLSASVWIKGHDPCDTLHHALNVQFVVQTRANGRTHWNHYQTAKMAQRFHGDWVQLVAPIYLTETADLIDIFVHGESGCREGIVVDDFRLVEHLTPIFPE
jgi:hypothetical protein